MFGHDGEDKVAIRDRGSSGSRRMDIEDVVELEHKEAVGLVNLVQFVSGSDCLVRRGKRPGLPISTLNLGWL